jgi:hypothetical protein
MVPIPAYLNDPFQLDALALLLGANPTELGKAIERDYAAGNAAQQPVYTLDGSRKAGFLMRTLEQCQHLALAQETAANSPTNQLSQALQHVQVQLAAVVGYYEQRLRQGAPTAPVVAAEAATHVTEYGELLRWREFLAIAPTLAPHLLDEPVLASITDHYGNTTAYPLKLERNPAADGERGLFSFEGSEEYQILTVADQVEEEDGPQLLRVLPAGMPLLAFDDSDEDCEERDEKMRKLAKATHPELFAAPVAGPPLFPNEPLAGPNYLP